MDSVQVLDDSCCEKAIALRNQVAEYTEQAFKMFGGQTEDIVLEFDRTLIGVVYDRFGEATQMMNTSNTKCIASVKVQIKFFERDGKRLLPLAIQVHHAVCDGYHIGVFVEKLQGYIDRF